jgi:hypothetical protein
VTRHTQETIVYYNTFTTIVKNLAMTWPTPVQSLMFEISKCTLIDETDKQTVNSVKRKMYVAKIARVTTRENNNSKLHYSQILHFSSSNAKQNSQKQTVHITMSMNQRPIKLEPRGALCKGWAHTDALFKQWKHSYCATRCPLQGKNLFRAWEDTPALPSSNANVTFS